MVGTAGKSMGSEWIGVVKRSTAAVIWTIGTSALTALAVEKEWMQFESIGYGAMVILAASGFLCGRSGKGSGAALQGLMSVGGYVAVLIVLNLLLFGGEFESVLLCISLVLLGLLIRLALNRGVQRRGRKRGYKIPKG